MLKDIRSVATSFQIINPSKASQKEYVLLHGWGCTWEIWSPLIPDLSEQGALIIPDLPSFGGSAEPKSVWDSYEYARWAVEFIKEVSKTKKVVLIGHSFGGKIATIVAAKHPELIEHLVIVDASGLPDELPLYRRAQEKLVSLVPRSIKDALKSATKGPLSKVVQFSTDYLNASTYQKTVLRKILKEQIDQELSQITVPTTIIWGVNDEATPMRHGQRFHQLIKGSKFKEMKRSGHFPFVDETQEFFAILNTL